MVQIKMSIAFSSFGMAVMHSRLSSVDSERWRAQFIRKYV